MRKRDKETRLIWPKIRAGLAVAGLGLMQSACAMSFVDDAGTKHVIGLVHLRLPDSVPEGNLGGSSVDVSSVGLLAYSTPETSGLSIGYSREILITVQNDALVLGSLTNQPGREVQSILPYVGVQ